MGIIYYLTNPHRAAAHTLMIIAVTGCIIQLNIGTRIFGGDHLWNCLVLSGKYFQNRGPHCQIDRDIVGELERMWTQRL